MSGLVGMKSGWYCFRTVSTSSRKDTQLTPALVFINDSTGEAWNLVISRAVASAMSYYYKLAWLKAGENAYSFPPIYLVAMFEGEITAFTVELRLKNLIDAEE